MKFPKVMRNYCAKRHLLGFTLIELLIVLFIISIVTSAALLTIRHNETKQLETITQEITARLQLAESEAMLMPAILGVVVTEQYLNFVRYTMPEGMDRASDEKPKSPWALYEDKVLTTVSFPEGASVKLNVARLEKNEQKESTEEQVTPAIVMSSNGDITPFTISIGSQGKSPQFEITGNANGAITYVAL